MSWTAGSLPARRGAAALAVVLFSCGAIPAAEWPVLRPAPPARDLVFVPRLTGPSSGTAGQTEQSWNSLAAGSLPAARGVVRTLPGGGFHDRLMTRMAREARRYRGEHLFDAAAASPANDSFGEALRARESERIIRRSFDHAVDDQLERLARHGLGLGGVLDRLENFGSFRGRTRPPAEAQAGPRSDIPDSSPRPFDAGVGLRIGAHPRLVLRAEARGLKGRIEVPILDEPLRLSIERDLGSRGRAVLTGGLDGGAGDWATLALNFSF